MASAAARRQGRITPGSDHPPTAPLLLLGYPAGHPIQRNVARTQLSTELRTHSLSTVPAMMVE
eukprot:755090-Hanusia_phi.AAC.4